MTNKSYILGIDEVGMGSLAGPVVSCGVLAPVDWTLEGLRDSKKFSTLSEKTQRPVINKLLEAIESGQIKICLAERSNTVIDLLGLVPALKETYEEILTNLYQPDCSIILDGISKFDNLGGTDYDIEWVVQADSKFPTVMAASIWAKTYCDMKMREFHLQYPQYGWNTNVGYGTKQHKDAIAKLGGTPLHRQSFEPLKSQFVKIGEDPRQLSFNEFK